MARKEVEKVERKKPERMGGFGDERLAEAITLRLTKLITPIQSRPKFAAVRKQLFVAVAMLQSITDEELADEQG